MAEIMICIWENSLQLLKQTNEQIKKKPVFGLELLFASSQTLFLFFN